MNRLLLGITALVSLHCFTVALALADPPTRNQLGRDVKLRIVVDKVMQPEAKWKTEEWMIRETAEAGFNVYSPRTGYADLDAVRRVTKWCAKYGIYHQVWMRGTLGVAKGDLEKAKGQMLVWRNGGEQPMWSPCSDRFWEWTTRYIVEYAKISAVDPHLMGVFLDYENYAKGTRMSGTVYDLSYDQMSLDRFAKETGNAVPTLEPEKRYPWLVENKLHEAFEKWQIDHWRTQCRELREKVDAIDPDFQFCMYPAPGSRFMLEAAFPEWTTKRAPLIFADAVTYGRPTSFLPEAGSLKQGRRLLEERMERVERVAAMKLPFIYTGGIDPVVRGADPEYSGKNAVMISETTDGYWIFYEGPKYKEDHRDYWKWFMWANRAIEAGRLESWHEPRKTPDPWSFEGAVNGLNVRPDPARLDKAVSLPPVRFRGGNLFLLHAEAGRPIEIAARSLRTGPNEHELTWTIRDLTWEALAEGMIPFGETGKITFTPKKDGALALFVSAGGSAYELKQTNTALGVFAGRGVGTIGGPWKLYFRVPKDCDGFTFVGRGAGAETVRLDAVDPSGKQVATAQSTPANNRAEIVIKPGSATEGTWMLEIGRAEKGVLEDVRVSLSGGIPAVLSLVPEQVFRRN